MTRWCLVVEDESPLGEMIVDNLVADGLGAELCRDGHSALGRLERGGVDLVVLDIMLPHVDGFEVLRRMRERGDDTPVLILSARQADSDRIRGLELKADDYLTKPFNLRELLLRVRALLRRVAPTPAGADTVTIGGCCIDFRAHDAVRPDGTHQRLSDSEIKLLRLLTFRPGEVVTRKEILDRVYGSSTIAATRTLDNLVLSLRRLLEEDSKNPRHLHTARGVGFRLTLDPES